MSASETNVGCIVAHHLFVDMKPGFYKVITNNHTFLLELQDYDGWVTMNYGDPAHEEGPCCVLTYDAQQPMRIKLDTVSYFARCSVGHDLERGHGTIEMLQSILKLSAQAFKDARRIYFNDVSGIECNGKTMLLSYMSLLIHGQTWYARHFGARPVKRELREQLNKFTEKLSRKPNDNLFSFYDDSIGGDTWFEYFANIRRKYGCEFFVQHEREIKAIARMDLLYSEWYINTQTALSYDVRVETRKAKRPTRHQHGGSVKRWFPGGLLTMEDCV